jgi:hypothetical protein
MRKTIGDYSEEERILIYDMLNKLHIKYGLGVCLSKLVHKVFHDSYGYYNNTPEQFEEFKQRYKNFEFDDLLEEKHKYKNVMLKEVG